MHTRTYTEREREHLLGLFWFLVTGQVMTRLHPLCFDASLYQYLEIFHLGFDKDNNRIKNKYRE